MEKNRERIFLSELKTLLEEEYLAGEKAKIFSHTMTDPLLAKRFSEFSQSHAQRFTAILSELEKREALL